MSNKGNHDKNANVVSIQTNANDFSKHRKDVRPSYPPEWKQHCLELLKIFKEDERQRLGYKRYGWSKVRDLIMVELDKSGSQSILGRDPRLSRQDLEAWERGTELSHAKFLFIDRFVRKMDIDGRLNQSHRVVQESRQTMLALSAQEMYQNHALAKGNTAALLYSNHPTGYMISNEVSDSWYKYLVIRIRSQVNAVFSIQAAYLPTEIGSLNNSNFGEIVFYDGLLIPVVSRIDNAFDISYSLNHVSLLKLYSAEFRGENYVGFADGELTLFNPIFGYDKDHDLERMLLKLGQDLVVELDFPNPVLQPVLVGADMHKKYFPLDAEEKESKERAWKENNGEISENDMDFFKTCRWKLTIKTLHDDQEIGIISNIFNEYYQGYSF